MSSKIGSGGGQRIRTSMTERFVIIRDSDLRAKIRKEFGNDQAQMTDASLLILMTAERKLRIHGLSPDNFL